jgi:hypothetical protein
MTITISWMNVYEWVERPEEEWVSIVNDESSGLLLGVTYVAVEEQIDHCIWENQRISIG